MTTTTLIATGAKEPIEVTVLDGNNLPLSGLNNVKVRIRRTSDDYFYDWSDETFKPVPTQILKTLSEVDPIQAPGRYQLDVAPHIHGWDTALITNPVADDIYVVEALQDGASTARNLPQWGELRVERLIDFVDIPVSSVAGTVRDVSLVGAPVGSLGEALSILLGVSGKHNVRMDNFVYSAVGLLQHVRIRVFPNAATAGASTPGGTSEGELYTLTLAATADGTLPTLPANVVGLRT